MTVAAVVVPDGVAEALSDAVGRTGVRRIIDVAWAGGAMPIVIVTADPDGAVAATIAGSPALLVEPGRASGLETWRLGARAAVDAVSGTSAVLLWPGRMTWTDPETVTSLIEAHGRDPSAVLRPGRAGRAGWPVLVPGELVAAVLGAPGGTIEDAVDRIATAPLELGDPGSVLGREVGLDDLPDYEGPPEPVGGPPPDWGAAAADAAELLDPD